mmetsp:Transcript_4238/g.6621  ORF Transcript_4238/g.6621 Transcript_4238/m.6621 type:complete len:199 (+) Transcript_4238:289-885(+)
MQAQNSHTSSSLTPTGQQNQQLSFEQQLFQLQNRIQELELENRKLVTASQNVTRSKPVSYHKANSWTCFNKIIMTTMNDTLTRENASEDVQQELGIVFQPNGVVVSNFNDKTGNQIVLRELGAYSGNVQGIMKHCGRLWQSIPGDVKEKWGQHAKQVNEKNAALRQQELAQRQTPNQPFVSNLMTPQSQQTENPDSSN